MKYVGFALLAIVGFIVALLLIALIRTLFTKPKTSTYAPDPDPEKAQEYAEKLAAMVQVNTVASNEDRRTEAFLDFHKVLAALFPRVHQHLEKVEIDGNLLYRWQGKSADKPIVLMAHQDVVPAEGEWVHEPFSGDIADGFVWGRSFVWS